MTRRILLDACVPERLRHDLAAAGTVETARYAGLAFLSNGALLAAMAGRFDVLVTTDTNVRYQQPIADGTIAVLVLRAGSNDIDDLRCLIPAALTSLETIQAGTVAEVY